MNETINVLQTSATFVCACGSSDYKDFRKLYENKSSFKRTDDGDLAGFKVSTEYIGRKCDMDVTYVNSNYFIVIRLNYK